MPELNLAGTALHYSDAGTGPAIVLLHGLYQDADCWATLAVELSASHRVVCCDLRGCGRSADGATVTIAQLAADLGALIDALGLDRPIVVGHSLGGQAALLFAVQQPQRLRGLVLAAVSPLAMDAAMGPAYGAFAQLAPAMGLTDQLADSMLSLVYSADSLDHGPGGLELYRRQLTLLRSPQEVATQIGAYTGRPALEDRLTAIACPTLIVAGELDTTVSLASAQLLNLRIAGSALVLLPDASHMAPLERPAEFKAALLPFLSRLGA